MKSEDISMRASCFIFQPDALPDALRIPCFPLQVFHGDVVMRMARPPAMIRIRVFFRSWVSLRPLCQQDLTRTPSTLVTIILLPQRIQITTVPAVTIANAMAVLATHTTTPRSSMSRKWDCWLRLMMTSKVPADSRTTKTHHSRDKTMEPQWDILSPILQII